MAKITTPSDFSQIQDAPTFMRMCSQFINDLVSLINGKIEFDSNLKTQSMSVTFSAANTDLAVSHSLGKSSVKYIVTSKSKSCDVFNGLAANTTNKLYLQCTQAATVTLELF